MTTFSCQKSSLDLVLKRIKYIKCKNQFPTLNHKYFLAKVGLKFDKNKQKKIEKRTTETYMHGETH